MRNKNVNFEKRKAALLILAMIFCFLTMYYADITVTSRYGFVFLDSIFDGKILSFYENALLSGVAPEGAVYDIGMYIVFGMWSLPLWLINKMILIDQLSIGSLLWYKILVIVFVTLCAYEFYKLAKTIMASEKRAIEGSILFLSSIMVFFPTFVVAQYDVIGLYFMLLGISGFFEDKKGKFIGSFAIAMLMKPFPIFAFILLLVIKQKNIIRILVDMILGVAPFIILKVLYSVTDGYKASAGAFVGNNMKALFSSTIVTNSGETSLFFLCLFLIYGIAYCVKKDCSNKAFKKYVILLLAFLWSGFMVFVTTAPYWIIYFEPFLLLVAISGTEVNNKLIFDFAANITILISMIFKYPWVYGGDKMYSYLVLKQFTDSFLKKNSGITVAGVLRQLTLENYLPVFDAIFAASLLVVLLLGVRELMNSEEKQTEEVKSWHFYIRIATLYIWILLTVGLLCLSIVLRG